MRNRQPVRDLRKNTGDPQYGRRTSILCRRVAGNSHSGNAERWYGRPYIVGEKSFSSGSSPAWPGQRRFARGAIHRSDPLSARIGDSVVGHFFRWKCFATWESAFYFSAGSYSTVGCGDLLLPWTWRAVGPVEGLTGVLMCGVSASLMFAIVARLVERGEQENW